jgi:glutamate 5-kinase
MGKATECINNSRKIVLKIGSNVLTGADGRMDEKVVENIVAQVQELRNDGKQVIIVSSGAEISGVTVANLRKRHGDIHYRQAMCAIGQVELMLAYKKYFVKSDVVIAQILLSRRNFDEPISSMHIRNALFTLLDEGVVPIINENDSVSIEELGFGDNDTLAALTANLWNADFLILMSDIDGVYDKPPKDDPSAKLIKEVSDIDALIRDIDTQAKSSFGRGGMDSKIEAARTVGEYGVPLLLVNGKHESILSKIAGGEDHATIFVAK